MRICLDCGSTEIRRLEEQNATVWQCLNCGVTRRIEAQQQPITEDKVVVSLKCHCCYDKGFLNQFDVIDYINADFQTWDSPILCMRDTCTAGRAKRTQAPVYAVAVNPDGGVIADQTRTVAFRGIIAATADQCETIHRINVEKANRKPPEPAIVQAAISDFGGYDF